MELGHAFVPSWKGSPDGTGTTVKNVTVIISWVLEGMFWEGIEHLLATVPDIDVIECGSEEELEEALRERKAQVLLLQVTGGESESEYQRYFSLHPGLTIIGLDPTGAEAVLRLRDIGRDLLVRLIRTVSVERPRSHQNETQRMQLLRAEDIKRLASNQIESTSDPAQPYIDSLDYLRDLGGWLDCMLQECLARRGPVAAEGGIPGWAMSADRAWSLLGEDKSQACIYGEVSRCT